MSRVVVTGNEGYVGGVLVPVLQGRGHEVSGIDSGLFADRLAGPPPEVPTVHQDIRDVPGDVFAGVDAVVHLAALSNDPLGDLDPDWTREVNLAGTVRLAELARAAGVRRFVFASSCIMYGAADGATADERAALDPRTDYARSKVAAERALLELAGDGFSPVLLRNGTIYGAGPRPRLDTVFNDFVATAVTEGRVVVRGDGRQWRPVVDLRDVAAAFAAAVEAPAEVVHAEAFNVGAEHLNQRILDLAGTAASLVAGASVEVRGEPSADRRSYRADFAKFGAAFPGLTFRTVREGGADLARAFAAGLRGVDRGRFVRLRALRELLDSGRVDGTLRPVEVAR